MSRFFRVAARVAVGGLCIVFLLQAFWPEFLPSPWSFYEFSDWITSRVDFGLFEGAMIAIGSVLGLRTARSRRESLLWAAVLAITVILYGGVIAGRLQPRFEGQLAESILGLLGYLLALLTVCALIVRSLSRCTRAKGLD